jgi:hypothetical protein
VRAAFGDRGSAGGHGTFAGGQIPLRGVPEDEIESIREDVLGDLLLGLGVDVQAGEDLVSEADSGRDEAG